MRPISRRFMLVAFGSLAAVVPAAATDFPVSPDTLESTASADPVETLRARQLTLPVEGVVADRLRDDFDAPRSGGRAHRAIDILAPRGTPVVAVEDGTILRVNPDNGAGGIVVQQVDDRGEYVYAYAHLERWASWIAEGMRVFRGQVLGYVGSTGNATTPHLHFTITPMGADGRPRRGVRINPFQVLR